MPSQHVVNEHTLGHDAALVTYTLTKDLDRMPRRGEGNRKIMVEAADAPPNSVRRIFTCDQGDMHSFVTDSEMIQALLGAYQPWLLGVRIDNIHYAISIIVELAVDIRLGNAQSFNIGLRERLRRREAVMGEIR